MRRGTITVLVSLLLIAGACSGSGGDGGDTTGPPEGDSTTAPDTADTGEALVLLPLSASDDQRIVDTEGREVLLRGTNLTSIGEYWQGDPDHEPTMPTTDADWDEMASRGFSVVRLVITWSLVEPERGFIDEEYLATIEEMVDAAAARGIYTVIDMHQDAYSAYISTSEGEAASCPPGTKPAKGWDGAPAWAVITDGLSTCITAERNDSPAVTAAWNHFYDNTDGIRDQFVAAWGAVAERFAGRPEVAGYDILNEPEVSRSGTELTPLYDELVLDTVTAIREAEAGADFRHLIFVEPAIPAADFTRGIVIPDPERIGVEPVDIVAAPHNYAESILEGTTIEQTNELFVGVAESLGVPLWIGEYGWWDTTEQSLEAASRMAADMDRLALGGAWWQWRQPCGDPHSIEWGGWKVMEPTTSTHLHKLDCPGDTDAGPTEELLDIVGRGYPRATPGRIVELTSDPATGAMVIAAASASVGSTLVVFTPTDADAATVESTGLTDVAEREVPGGRIITAVTESADYSLELIPT